MFYVFCFFFSVSSLAQPVSVPPVHATVTAQPMTAPVKPGANTTLVVDVVPRAGIHIYAPPQKRYKPVAIAIDAADGVKIGAAVFPPAPTLEFEGEKVRAYNRAFRIQVPITIDTTTPAHNASIPITGKVTYQACDDVMCYVPKTVPVRWEIALKQQVRRVR